MAKISTMKNQFFSKNSQILIHKTNIHILHFNAVTQFADLLHQMTTSNTFDENYTLKTKKRRIKKGKHQKLV